MDARSIKEWSVSNGDFQRSEENDYEKQFQSAKVSHKLFEKKLVIAFSLSGLGIILMVLEYLTKV